MRYSNSSPYRNLISAKINWEFFQAVSVSVQLYSCNHLDFNKTPREAKWEQYKSWKLHTTKQQLCGHLPLTWPTIQIRWSRNTNGEIKVNLWCSSINSYTGRAVLDSQQKLTYISSMKTLDAVSRINQKCRLIKMDDMRESKKSMLSAWFDDDDNEVWSQNVWLLNKGCFSFVFSLFFMD